MKPINSIFLILAVLSFFTERISACRCLPPIPPCYAFGMSDAVFVGKIEKVTKGNENSDFIEKVEIEVEKSFKGIEKKRVFSIDYAYSDCEHSFYEGGKYLFYGGLSENGEIFSEDGLCGRTHRFDNSLIDFDFLNLVNDQSPIYWIWGTFSMGEEPVKGMKAEILDGNKKTVVFSDSDGNIKFPVSKAGKYPVRVVIPRKMSPRPPNLDELHETIKRWKVRKGIYTIDFLVDVKPNQCGWFDVPVTPN